MSEKTVEQYIAENGITGKTADALRDYDNGQFALCAISYHYGVSIDVLMGHIRLIEGND